MIPWYEGTTIIGTTERMENCSCDEVKLQEEDINYLLNCANHYLKEPISRDDICGTFLGIRPLVIDKHDETDATWIVSKTLKTRNGWMNVNWGVIQYKRILENLGFNTVKYILKSGIQAVNA